MSVPISVADIQDRVRYRCDLPAFTSDSNTSTTDILMLVQESARRLSGVLNDLSQEAYFNTTTTLTTIPGVPVVSLPTNCDKLVQIHWVRGDNDVVPLEMANLDEVQPSEAYTSGWDTARTPKYRLSGNTIEFFPTPQTAESVFVRYSTGLFITSSADTFYGSFGWDTWIVLDVACTVRQRLDKDYQALFSEKQLIEQEIRKQARRRDRAGRQTVRNVRGDEVDPYDWRRRLV